MIHHIVNKEDAAEHTAAHSAANGIGVIHSVQTQTAAYTVQRESHAKRYSGTERGGYKCHQTEVMSVLNAEVSIHNAAHGELLQHLKRHGGEQCAFRLVVADNARTFQYRSVYADTDTVRELE